MAARRNRLVAPHVPLLVGLLKNGAHRGGREPSTQEASHPVHDFALGQPAHGQRKQHLVQAVPLMMLHQSDLFPPPQPRNAHLLQTAPQRGPTFSHRVAPTIDFLPTPLGFVHPPIALCLEQAFDGPLQHLARLFFHLSPGLFQQLLQCYSPLQLYRHRMSPLFDPCMGRGIRRPPFISCPNFQQKILQTERFTNFLAISSWFF